MPVETVGQFAQLLSQNRLLEPDQQREVANQLLAQFAEPRALAAELVRRGWLTEYQVSQIFLDRGQDLLLGSYVLLERLGEGGMGTVFKAHNWKLGQIVAVKLIRKERLESEQALQRFQREIRLASK